MVGLRGLILVECDPDFAFVRSLGYSKRRILHCYGKGSIARKLKKTRDYFCLIDEDPGKSQPSYFMGLPVDTECSIVRIRVLRDDDKDHTIVVLCPRLEECVLETARRAGINAAKFGLPNEASELKKVINGSHGQAQFRTGVSDEPEV